MVVAFLFALCLCTWRWKLWTRGEDVLWSLFWCSLLTSHPALSIPNQQRVNIPEAEIRFTPVKVLGDCPSGMVLAMETCRWSQPRKITLKFLQWKWPLCIWTDQPEMWSAPRLNLWTSFILHTFWLLWNTAVLVNMDQQQHHVESQSAEAHSG